MGRLSIDYPDNFTASFNQSKDAFEREAKMAMAVKLFEIGRLTSGQAAHMAGVSRVQFLLECSRFGVPSVSWEQEEIEAELRDKKSKAYRSASAPIGSSGADPSEDR